MPFKAHRFNPIILFLILFSSSYDVVSSQTDCTVTLNSALVAGSDKTPPWTSRSGVFALGFRPLQRSSASSNEDLFLLSIWLSAIPEQTIVWSLNRQVIPRDSHLQLTGDGRLVLSDPGGSELWRSPNTERSSCASMLDSGNFVLTGGDGPLWQSFDDPTDTILPGQRLTEGARITSRQTAANYSDGRFQLRMQSDGNLVLYSVFLPTEDVNSAYWSTRTVNPNSDTQLVFDESGFVYLRRGNENILNITKGDLGLGLGLAQDYYHLARIDFDGVLRFYRRPKSVYAADAGSCASAWSIFQTVPKDICSALMDNLGSGACGYNSYCVSSGGGGPRCVCPDGYSLLDPLDPFRGCKPDFSLPSCQSNGWESSFELVEFREINNTDWPLTDYELQTGVEVDKEACKDFCRRDCFCAAAIYNGNNCWKKKFPLSNGRQSKDVNRVALIKVPRNGAAAGSCPGKKDRTALVLVGSLLLGSSVFVNVLLLLAIGFGVFFLYNKRILGSLDAASSVPGMRRYSYKELEDATGNFKQQLGKGSFGTVYKGVTPEIPRRFVAVKRLDNFEEDGREKEFATEVKAIARTHHKNLVTLLGYCDEKDKRLLVYEYMSNGSLSSLLFGIQRPRWNKRTQIARGIARGLTYLHEECPTQIIHCDVKPQNILIDEYLTPKVSDFGMAKLLLTDQSRAARTHIRGTVGYFAPEWFKRASVSAKVDVYSFGVMLVEIVCCTSCVEFAVKEEEEALVDWAYECYGEGTVGRLVENDEEALGDLGGVERFVMVAMWCVQEDPSLRPTMRRVSQMLEGVAEVSVPPRPFGV